MDERAGQRHGTVGLVLGLLRQHRHRRLRVRLRPARSPRASRCPSSALDAVLYGAPVIVFLLFEPLGLYGIWVKIRNYWKGWPFTY